MEKAQQEFILKLSIFEQQIQQFQQQLQAVEQNIIEIDSLSFGLDELVGNEGKEVLAQIGRGIFVKTKLLSDDLIVNVGKGNFVKKSISETKKLIEKQIEKLEEVRKELNDNLGNLGKELEKVMREEQSKEKKDKDYCIN